MKPCPCCMRAYKYGLIRDEAIQPLPEGAQAPLGLDGKPQCRDCAAAGTLARLHGLEWDMMRTAVGNDRQEQYRLPGAPMGLVGQGLVRLSEPGEFERHLQWLAEIGVRVVEPREEIE